MILIRSGISVLLCNLLISWQLLPNICSSMLMWLVWCMKAV